MGTKRCLGATSSNVDRHEHPGSVPDRLDCERAHELVSAAADDEIGRTDQLRLDAHLDACPGCDAYADRVARLTRTVRLRPLAARPDFVEQVMARSYATRLGRGAWLRPALAWCGVVIAAQSIPPLVFADLDGTPTHVARHVGASALALAIGFLYVAWRPGRASGLLPFAAALLATTIAGAVLDTASGERSALAEATHLAELVGLVLLWFVAGSPGWERVRGALHAGHRRGGGQRGSPRRHQLSRSSALAPSRP